MMRNQAECRSNLSPVYPQKLACLATLLTIFKAKGGEELTATPPTN